MIHAVAARLNETNLLVAKINLNLTNKDTKDSRLAKKYDISVFPKILYFR